MNPTTTLNKREKLWQNLLTKLAREESASETVTKDLVERAKIVDRALAQISVERMTQHRGTDKPAAKKTSKDAALSRLAAFKLKIVDEQKKRRRQKKTA